MQKPALAVVEQSSEFEIDRGIPLPPKNEPWPKYPFEKMKVGDSFFVKGDNKVILRARYAARDRAKRSGESYTSRRKANGVRIWRTA